jgi:hypothetical protein
MRRQKILQEVGGFDANATEIFQSGSPAFFIELADAPKESFDADEICFRMLPRVLKKKRSIAATEFYLEWLRR